SVTALVLAPFEKRLEQFRALGIAERGAARWRRLREERVEALLGVAVGRRRRLGAVDEGLRERRAMPAFERRGIVHLAPFGMMRRLQELIEIAEKGVDEALELLVADVVVAPVERHEHGADRDGIDAAAGRDEIGI